MKKILLIILVVILGCSKQPVENIDVNNSISEISFTNIQPNNQIPDKVQYLFSLRDQDNHAVEIPYNELKDVQIDISENDQPVDNYESNIIIHNSDNFGMDVVLVLDFSASMQNNDGVSFMIEGAKSLINSLKPNHRIGIVEFHDNNPESNYSIIQEFTADKELAENKLDDFVSSGYYSGFSTCWDAVNLAFSMFPDEIDYQTVRSVIFLSDGNDNSSLTSLDDLTTIALDKNIRIYNIGIGDISEEHQALLNSFSEQTGGNFYQNDTIGFLQNEFDKIISDLGGNYVISYITPQIEPFIVNISLTYKNITTTAPISETIDPNLISGDNRLGILQISDNFVNGDSIYFYLNAVHIPRDIAQLKFKIVSDIDYSLEKTNQESGGLIYNWSDLQQDENGFWNTQGENLSFGDFGKLIKIIFPISRLEGFSAKFILDNSIYQYGIKLYGGDLNELDNNMFWRTEFVYGFAIYNPQPNDFSVEQDSSITFGWTTTNDSLNIKYTLFLDKENPPQTILADSLSTETFQTIVDTASTYFWRVKAFSSSDEKYSNIWRFTTK